VRERSLSTIAIAAPAVLTESTQRVMFVCASECACVCARACMYMRLLDISLPRFLVLARTRVHTLMRVLQKIRGNKKKVCICFLIKQDQALT
jgi:hypothetical protein